IVPVGVMRPIALVVPRSVNQTLPSGPGAMKKGVLLAFSPFVLSNSVITPDGVIRPIARVVPSSTNQRLPSAPGAMSCGLGFGFRPFENSLMTPDGVAPPTAFAPGSVSQTSPSGRGARPCEILDAGTPVGRA